MSSTGHGLRPRSLPVVRALACCAAALSLAACGADSLSSKEAIATFSLTTRANIDTYAVVPDQLKLAAANVFRALAVDADTQTAARLKRRAADALYAEEGIHRSLAPEVRRQITPLLHRIDLAAANGDGTATRAAALEVARLLYQDLSSSAEKQAAFALIDNRLLAMKAELDAKNPDWHDIDAGARVANNQRQVLHDRSEVGPNQSFDQALDTLQQEFARRDKPSSLRVLMDTRQAFDRYRARYDSAIPDQALVSSRATR